MNDQAPVRYVLHPGYVTSTNDGQQHYIGAAALAHLYGLRLEAPNVVIYDKRLSHHYTLTDIHLRPRRDGKYIRITA